MKLKLTLLPALLFISLHLFAQQPPEEFFKGMEAMSVNRGQAKADLLVAVQKMPDFHGTYHFLGVIYTEAGQQDSAIFYLEKAVNLNAGNVNKTREMSVARLIDAYMFSYDFEKAYQKGWEAVKLYPENRNIAMNFKDVCIWAYYIKHTGLDKKYLSPVIRDDYAVTSISQEYLIMRRLIHNGDYIQRSKQSLQQIDNVNYDVHTWATKKDPKDHELKFKLNWNMDTEFGGKPFPTDPVVASRSNPIYERLGALLVKNSNADLKTEIEKLSE